MKKNLVENLTKKILSETLQDKAEALESKLKKDVNEDLGGMEDAHPTFGEMTPEDLEKYTKKHFGTIDTQDDEWINLNVGPEDEEADEYPDFIEAFESEKSEAEMCSECGGSGMMNEIECNECGGTGMKYEMEEGLYDVAGKFPKKQSFDYVEEQSDIEDDQEEEQFQIGKDMPDDEACMYHKMKFGPTDERTKKFCIGLNIPEMGLDKHMFSMNESLKGNQKKIDTNKNGKIDAEDFKLLRNKKKTSKTETEEGNAFTGKLAQTKKGEKFKLGNKTYKDTSNLDEKENNKYSKKYPVVEKWEGDVEVKKTGEHSGKTIEQINSEIKSLKKKSESYKEKGKKVPSSIKEKMSELYFAKRAKQGWKGEGKAKVKESLKLKESELVELISLIVEKENRKTEKNIKSSGNPPGLKKYEQAHKASGKENSDYLKSLEKKMKEYLKDGSKGKFETNPDFFPKGNGELAKMDKKAYVPSDAVKDYTDNLTAAGLENLDYDEIHPNEKWVEDNVVGSSKTGNNPEWANTGKSDVNKKRNEVRKKNMLAKIKRKAYNKAPQPVLNDKTGEDEGSKILMKLESKEEKRISEEFSRMQQLIGYNKNTQ